MEKFDPEQIKYAKTTISFGKIKQRLKNTMNLLKSALNDIYCSKSKCKSKGKSLPFHSSKNS